MFESVVFSLPLAHPTTASTTTVSSSAASPSAAPPTTTTLSVIFENLRNIRGSGGGQLGALLDAGEHEWWCPYGIQIEIFKLDGTTSSQGTNSRPHSRKSSSTNGSKHFSHHTKIEVFCCSAIRFVLDSSCHCTFFLFLRVSEFLVWFDL